MTPAIRMQRQRKARQEKGLKEVRLWLTPSTLSRLDTLCQKQQLSRAEVISLLLLNEGMQE